MDLCYRSGRRSVMRFGRWLVAGLKLAADTIDTAMTPSWGRPRSFGFPRVARTLLDFSRMRCGRDLRCGRDPRAHRSTPKPVRGALTQSSENMDVPLTVADVADPLSSDAVALLRVIGWHSSAQAAKRHHGGRRRHFTLSPTLPPIDPTTCRPEEVVLTDVVLIGHGSAWLDPSRPRAYRNSNHGRPEARFHPAWHQYLGDQPRQIS